MVASYFLQKINAKKRKENLDRLKKCVFLQSEKKES